VTLAQQLFFDYVHCGSCSAEVCLSIAGLRSGLNIRNIVLVESVTWGVAVLSLLLVGVCAGIAWLQFLEGRMRWLLRGMWYRIWARFRSAHLLTVC
jgi:hypothetical protein